MNSNAVILVEGTAEREKLKFCSVPEQPLGHFAEPHSVVQRETQS